MKKSDKLIERFRSCPKDFSWNELTTLLNRLGFAEMQGKGSRVKFFNQFADCMIHLHKPHPSKILKSYLVKEILNTLIEEKLI